MIRRLVRYILAVGLATAGLTVVSATPALAVGGCNNANQTLTACFDYPGGSRARADFYLKRGPDGAIHSYRLAIVINGTTHMKVNTKTRFGSQGRHCCWYQHVDNLPNKAQAAFTRVWVYRSDGALHFVSDSPTIRYSA